MYALKKPFLYNNHQLPNRDIIMKELLSRQFPSHTFPVREALFNQFVNIPSTLTHKAITLKDLPRLERANKLPIAVYYIDVKKW